MHSDQNLHDPSPPEQVSIEADARLQQAAGETIKYRLSALMQRVQQQLVRPLNRSRVAARDLNPAAQTGNSESNVSDRGLISQINALDHQHMQAFPADRKAQVMEKIMSLTPVQSTVSQGNHQFEKSVMNLHREGYGLIDLQPQETVFTTVWYRKNRGFVGKSADVTMLLWEDDENGASVSMMSWRI